MKKASLERAKKTFLRGDRGQSSLPHSDPNPTEAAEQKKVVKKESLDMTVQEGNYRTSTRPIN